MINPKDMIVHRVVHNEDDESQLTSSYLNFQQKYSQVSSENNIQPPKQYYNEISNERSQSYSISVDRHREGQPKYGRIH